MQLVHVNHASVFSLDGVEYEADPDSLVFDLPQHVADSVLTQWPGIWRTPEAVAAEQRQAKEAAASLASLQAEVEQLRAALTAAVQPAPAKAQRATKR